MFAWFKRWRENKLHTKIVNAYSKYGRNYRKGFGRDRINKMLEDIEKDCVAANTEDGVQEDGCVNLGTKNDIKPRRIDYSAPTIKKDESKIAKIITLPNNEKIIIKTKT